MPFVNEELPDFSCRTIDKERGIILTKLYGGRSEDPFRFRLTIPGREPVEFEAYQRLDQPNISKGDGSFIVHWKDVEVFSVLDDFLKSVIVEAMLRYGFASSNDHNQDTVYIEFLPR